MADNWRSFCDEVNLLLNEITSEIQELQKLQRIQAESSSNKAKLRKMFHNVQAQLASLNDGLEQARESKYITEKEYIRRQDQISNFTRRRDDLLRWTNSQAPSDQNKELFVKADPSKKGRVWGAPQETEQTRLLDNQGLLQYQTTIVNEQDRHIEDLSHIVSKQKAVAIAISNELDDQKVLLDDLDNKIDKSDSKLKKTGRRLFDVSISEAKTAWSFCCILILFLVLIGILLLVIFLL